MKISEMSSLLTLNYFKSYPRFPIVDFEQVTICLKNYLAFYSFGICFNVSTRGRQDLTRNTLKPSITQKSIQGTLESLYKCDHQF